MDPECPNHRELIQYALSCVDTELHVRVAREDESTPSLDLFDTTEPAPELAPSQVAAISEHLQACPTCDAGVEELQDAFSALQFDIDRRELLRIIDNT